MLDRLEAMNILLAVADAGSISAGSRKLNVPLSSVSRKIVDLERHLGAKLLTRTSRNLQLTDAGQDFIAAARQILAQVEEAERLASGEYQVPKGVLTVTMPIEFGRRHVLSIALEFLAEHPDVSLNILSSDRALHLVEESVDVGVRLGVLADSSFHAVKVGEARMLTCASPAYLARNGWPMDQRQLGAHDGVVFDSLANVWWKYAADAGRVCSEPRPRVRVNTAGAAVEAAVKGIGIVRVLDFMVADELRTGKLVQVFDASAGELVPVHLIYPKQGLLAVKVRAFVDWCAPRLRADLKRLRSIVDVPSTRT